MTDQKKSAASDQSKMSRRQFLGTTALAAAGLTVVPRYVVGGSGQKAPSDRVNIAAIGVGGMGKNNTRSLAEMGENIYAICDVDYDYAGPVFAQYPKAKKYMDFRKMLDNEPEIDAVMVATPDHNHAMVAIYAMKHGKHAFVQKPLTHSIYEARRMAQVAKETGVATQMGNQGHAFEGTYLILEWIQQGAIGDVTRVDCFTNRPKGYWPQGAGVHKPEEIPAVPSTLDWDLWIGPQHFRPYHPAYAPFVWRGWWDFGTGAIGDMGAHIMDQPYWALDLGDAEWVYANSTPFNDQSYPLGSIVHYRFPARGKKPPVDFTWYDGGLLPPRPDDLEEGRQMGDTGGGMIFYGTKGKLMASVYGNNPRLIPESFMQKVGPPKKTLKRSPGIHEEWINEIKGGPQAKSNFGYAAKLTETMLLGNVAIKFSDANKHLKWNADNMAFTNHPEANDWLAQRHAFRPIFGDIIG